MSNHAEGIIMTHVEYVFKSNNTETNVIVVILRSVCIFKTHTRIMRRFISNLCYGIRMISFLTFTMNRHQKCSSPRMFYGNTSVVLDIPEIPKNSPGLKLTISITLCSVVSMVWIKIWESINLYYAKK